MAGFNVQNLPKAPAFGFDLRSCIKAPDGKKLVIVDLSQIEARITRWGAGDEEMLELIRGGMNIYEAHARLTMDWEGEPGTLQATAKETYDLAKARELALGFGCGWQKFRDQAQLIYGVGLNWPDLKFKMQVKDYRQKNAKIPRLWNRLEQDFRASVGGDYELELPSGRVLTYFDVQAGNKITKVAEPADTQPSEFSRQGYRARVEINGPFKWLYGGQFCENFSQGTAADVFGEALLRVEDNRPDLTYLWPTHDEAVYLADEEDDTAGRDVKELFSVTPDWLSGCPIGAKVTEALRYEK